MIYDSSLYIFKLPFVSLLQLHLNGNEGGGGTRRDWDKNHDTDLHLFSSDSSSSDNFERYVSGKLSTSANVIQGNKKIVSLVILITVIMTRGVHVVQQLKWRNFLEWKSSAMTSLQCEKRKKSISTLLLSNFILVCHNLWILSPFCYYSSLQHNDIIK